MTKKAKIRSMYGKMQELETQERDVAEGCKLSSDRIKRKEMIGEGKEWDREWK